jgi:hypothetical protein
VPEYQVTGNVWSRAVPEDEYGVKPSDINWVGGGWSYGLDENRHVLETFLRRHHAEGLSPRVLSPEELFHPSTHKTHRI